MVTILSQVLKAAKVSTVVPANNGSQVVAVTVLVTSGSKVVTVVITNHILKHW
ncbi:MAG: hypothetical protein R2728_08125 [Chitinophagales bacterium]